MARSNIVDKSTRFGSVLYFAAFISWRLFLGLVLDEVLPRTETGAGNFAPEPLQRPRRVSYVLRRDLCHGHHVLLVCIVVDDCLHRRFATTTVQAPYFEI